MLIGLVEGCNDVALANILSIVQKIMLLFQIVVPIIAIIGLVKTLIKLTVDPENKKAKSWIKNWFLALLIFFMLPFIINVVMGWLDGNFSFANCWNYAKHSTSDSSGWSYDNTFDQQQHDIIK
ncbi:MAG: hypothetical protein IKH54_07590 [Bacilli bacterium]|nr:hypothetical protein [Bacilli bacterium]